MKTFELHLTENDFFVVDGVENNEEFKDVYPLIEAGEYHGHKAGFSLKVLSINDEKITLSLNDETVELIPYFPQTSLSQKARLREGKKVREGYSLTMLVKPLKQS